MTDPVSGFASASVVVPPVYKGASDTSAFASNALKFLNTRREKEGEVFGGRIVTWGIVFAASHAAVKEVLEDACNSFSVKSAYELFTGLNLYGENVLFSDGEKHDRLRKLLLQSDFAHTGRLAEKKYVHLIRTIIENFTKAMSLKIKLKKNKELEINVYDTMKTLCADILAGIFLGFKIKDSSEGNVGGNCKCKGKSCKCITVVEGNVRFQELQSRFWRATTSSGIKLNLSFFGMSFRSAYAKGEAAKQQILDILRIADKKRNSDNKLANSESLELHQAQCRCPFASLESKSEDPHEETSNMTEEERLSHYLMFSSSMVAKSVASVITSFMLERTQKPEILNNLKRHIRPHGQYPSKTDDSYLDRLILEVERLYPPIIGCCRYAKKDVQIRGKSIPSGSHVWCSFLTSNRDPEYFPDPLSFSPDRWQNFQISENGLEKDHPTHFSFGAFSRACLGKPLAKVIVREIIRGIIVNFDWNISPNQNLEYRWLPVVRPVDGLNINLSRC